MSTPPVVSLGVSAAGKEAVQLAGMMNRHGLVAGATGTGKTVTLQVLAEGLSQIGVPVFTADIKGDLSGLAEMGKTSPGWKNGWRRPASSTTASRAFRWPSGTSSASRARRFA